MSQVARPSTSDPWGLDPLGWIISPNPSADFLASTYEQAPLIVQRDEPDRFSTLLSIAAIDRLIAGTDLKEGQLDLANAAINLSRERYLDGNGYVDRASVARHYRDGATIILQQLHALDPTLSRFCAAMEHVFSCSVQTNIYLTPASNQGFRTHYDNHDVFVIQVAGQKDWRFYNSFDIPYRGEGFDSRTHETGPVTAEITLKAGDVAYVPRGLMHDARTSGGEPSLHITMGIMVKTWAELLLEAVAEVALREPLLRRSLPPGYAREDFDRSRLAEPFEAIRNRLAAGLKLDPALDLFADTFIRSRGADTRGAVLGAAEPVGPDTVLQARPFAPWRLERRADAIRLVTAGGVHDFDSGMEVVLRHCLAGNPVSPAGLPVGTPAAIAIFSDLLVLGLMERVA